LQLGGSQHALTEIDACCNGASLGQFAREHAFSASNVDHGLVRDIPNEFHDLRDDAQVQ
jgi:hypothetical protein